MPPAKKAVPTKKSAPAKAAPQMTVTLKHLAAAFFGRSWLSDRSKPRLCWAIW
jgi:hypothetical protein